MVSSTSPAGSAIADDLLVFLAVARSGTYVTAADDLGLNHTTVSRRMTALERQLGGRLLARSPSGWELTELGRSALAEAEHVEAAIARLRGDHEAPALNGVIRISATDGFSALVVPPAVARLRRRHPGISLEVVTTTRRALQHRTGLDLEVVVGKPEVRRAEAIWLADYRLGLYASRAWLAEHGTPGSVAELSGAPLIYFIDSMLSVDPLDAAPRILPAMRDALTSTNVFVHVEATRGGAGLGLLPCFIADRHDDLVRLFPAEASETLGYWLVSRREALRQPAVAAFVAELRAQVDRMRGALLPE
ncbi:LysR family transcriptional regulator [Tersicoccus sp. Bi-70]|uniref:LysR family transcriptional regulator n=1 Tax=Tersicoccus sp. Bi-70 TaxID=1897634 RepID=UPI000976B473|nr:LysR family transcriptional regulator [Tersicoccus sp. Bi-70]OMH32489.1 LysR family transcriptional regulator [Tersicoccus sp. Bi-70]